MAFTFTASRGIAESTTAGTTQAISPSSAIPVAAVAVLAVSTDNLATVANETNNHLSVADTDGHTWTKLKEWTQTAGVAADGVTISLWATKVTAEIGTGDSVTVTFSASLASRVVGLAEFAIGAGNTFQLAAAEGARSPANTTVAPAIAGLTSAARLWLGAIGWETTTAFSTEDADYTQIATDSIGSGAAGISLSYAYRIATLTGDTYSPTIANGRDIAGVLVALDEVAEPGDGEIDGALFTLAPTFFQGTITAPADAYEAEVRAKGASHYWPMDQVVGGVLEDVIGGIDMVVEGAPQVTDGPTSVLSAALRFDGVDDAATVNAPSYIGDGSIVAWIRTQALGQTVHDEAAFNTADTQRIGSGAFVQIDSGAQDDWEWHGADDVDAIYDLVGNQVVVDQWELMAVTIQASGARFYMIDAGVVTLKDSDTTGNITEVDWQVFRAVQGRAANEYGQHDLGALAAFRSALTITDLQDLYDAAQGDTQALTGSLFSHAPTFPQGAVAPGGVDLAGSLFSKAPTFHTGAVAGTVDLVGALFSKAPTFHAGEIAAVYDLVGSLFAHAPTFNQGTVEPGAVDLVGSLFAHAPTFHAGAVSQGAAGQDLTGSLFVAAPGFFQGAVEPGAVDLAGSLFSLAPTFSQGLVEGGSALAGQLYLLAPSFPQGAVAPGPVALAGALHQVAPSFPQGAVTPGEVGLAGSLFTLAPTFAQGLVEPGEVDLAGELFEVAAVFPAGLVQADQALVGTLLQLAPTFFAGLVSDHAIVHLPGVGTAIVVSRARARVAASVASATITAGRATVRISE